MVFILKVKKNLETVENCVKNICKITQYRKWRKGIYHIELNKLKRVLVNYNQLVESAHNNMEHNGLFIKKIKQK